MHPLPQPRSPCVELHDESTGLLTLRAHSSAVAFQNLARFWNLTSCSFPSPLRLTAKQPLKPIICNGSGFLFPSVLGAHGKAEAGLAIGGDAGYHEPFARKLPPSRYAAW